MQVLVLLVLASLVLWRIVLYCEIQGRLSRIRAAGQPVSGSELNVWRGSIPDAENGATLLTQAFALVRTFSDSRSNEIAASGILARTNTWGEATRGLVESYLETNRPALRGIQEGLVLSRFRYPADFSYGPDTELPHLRPLKESARIVALKAALEAERGETGAWADDVALGVALAGTLNDEPSIISHLARSGIIRTAVKATERGLNRIHPDPGACKRLQDAFAGLAQTNLLPLAFVGERAMLIPAFRPSWREIQNRKADGYPHPPQRYAGRPTTFLWLTGFFERDLNFFLKMTAEWAELAPPRSYSLTNHIGAAEAVCRRRGYSLCGLLLPAYSKVVVREAETQVLADLAITALAIERFRQKCGHLPASLTELTPDWIEKVPRDPFDGAPLRYRALAKGYVVYSVDADGRDDGGREAPDRRKSTDKTPYDLTFVVERY